MSNQTERQIAIMSAPATPNKTTVCHIVSLAWFIFRSSLV
jgi:hypothetical protein